MCFGKGNRALARHFTVACLAYATQIFLIQPNFLVCCDLFLARPKVPSHSSPQLFSSFFQKYTYVCKLLVVCRSGSASGCLRKFQFRRSIFSIYEQVTVLFYVCGVYDFFARRHFVIEFINMISFVLFG